MEMASPFCGSFSVICTQFKNPFFAVQHHNKSIQKILPSYQDCWLLVKSPLGIRSKDMDFLSFLFCMRFLSSLKDVAELITFLPLTTTHLPAYLAPNSIGAHSNICWLSTLPNLPQLLTDSETEMG